MKKYFIILFIFLLSFSFAQQAMAGCWVDDGTFYSTSRLHMTRFAIAMDQGDKVKALQMVDDGRIKSCSKASCTVLERTDAGLVKVNVLGIGTVWIWHTFLHCR